MQRKPVSEQVIVVMGASSGIGRETTLRFAKKGAKLVVSSRNQNDLNSLVAEIEREGGKAVAIAADVADSEQVKKVADKAVTEYGRLDTWVHVAATSIYASFEDTKPDEFKRVIEVNLLGQVYGAQAALPYLRQTDNGGLIHVSSIEGKVPLPFQSAYASAKHGIIGFLDVLRLELKKEGVPISVTNVMPASINTPLFNQVITRLGVKPMPVPPIYEPGVVADVILYAAEHPARDMVAGGAGKVLILMKRLSPSLLDAFLLRTAFKGQKTKEAKTDTAPNNLYQPLSGFGRVQGDFSQKAKNSGISNWFEKHPLFRRGAKVGTVLGAISMLFSRSNRASD